MENDLYSEARPDIAPIAAAMMPLSEELIVSSGAFLPHGLVIDDCGELKLISARPEGGGDFVSAVEILPALCAALRSEAMQRPIRTIAVAESVTVSSPKMRSTEAIKLLIEHKNGFCTALYRPYKKRLLRGYCFESMFAMPAEAMVRAWGQKSAVA